MEQNGLQTQTSTTTMSKLTRGFSKVPTNQELVNETRHCIENNYKNLYELNEISYYKFLNNELTCYSFMLPNLNRFDDYKFKEYLQNDLLELPAQFNLTESGHLNWWTHNEWENVCSPLYPMITSGDGNCLLHAASLAMWGLHDRYLILRKALNSTLKQIKEDNSNALWRRWKWEQMCQNRLSGLIYDDDEWSKEWNSLLKLSSYQPRVTLNQQSSSKKSNTKDQESNHSSSSMSSSSIKSSSNIQSTNNLQDTNTCYFESLEEFHVFLLANILQRPIIIVSDTMLHDLNGEPLSPIPFGGIYLPFECDLSKCHRYPLVLAYDSAHFSALVLMNEDEDMCQLDYDEEINHLDNDMLSNDEINQINKKLQLKPPYSIIPLQYSNKELLPVHFAHDPGENYDWSKFPMKNVNSAVTKEKSRSSASSNSNHSSNDNMSISSANNTYQKNSFTTELSPSEKMFLIQKYIDICKIDLFDSGPLTSKRNQQAFNSNGMCAAIHNVFVAEPMLNQSAQSAKKTKLASNFNNKLQKFLNFFKRNEKSDKPSKKSLSTTTDLFVKANGSRKSMRNNYISSDECNGENTVTTLSAVSLNPHVTTHINGSHASNTLPLKFKSPNIAVVSSIAASSTPSTNTKPINTIFHKQQQFKSWNSLFDSMQNHASFLCAKLNLAKPPRFKTVLINYIESARQRFELIKQQQKAQLIQHQQQQQQIYLQQQHQLHQQKLMQQQQHAHQLNNRYIPANNGPRKMYATYQCPFNRINCGFDSYCQHCRAQQQKQHVCEQDEDENEYETFHHL